ncbi:protein RADIALIS-like 4 isoform X2 [Dioscorea cayenensis subsp. rotundata]|uniref:Protein RADIALIS-like 4 isoform X2 n=1 Tax=Dioscorea cayennensis subsp. rotundata TaxID=55577 RepID=A0AB40C9U7_DIOCR|nr:protein RADIALIS-like 4 isoform X2 [Dioscorea cayenensis subsp. rotundata]
MDHESENESCFWSWEDNKKFEIALAVIDEESPERWEKVSTMIGGTKSAEEVEEHYEILLKDLNSIESGTFDHELDLSLHDDDGDDHELFAGLSMN